MGDTQSSSCDDLFGPLCDLFDNELERQQAVLTICRAQGRALRARDTESLNRHTTALELLNHEAAQVEPKRRELLLGLHERRRIPKKRGTLTDLIHGAAEPWRARLLEFQMRMRHLIAETQTVVQANARLLQVSMKVIGDAIDSLELAAGAAPRGYTARGADSLPGQVQPALIDQKG